MGEKATDWIFVYGGGVKPRRDGQFLVDGWIGNNTFPALDGEQVAVAVALVDESEAPSLDKESFKVLKDVPATAISSERIFRVDLDDQALRCRDAGNNGIWPPPESGDTIDITCPLNQTVTIDRIGDTWRYAIGGVVRPALVPENLSVNIIYQRMEEHETNWIFLDSGGTYPHPDGQFLVEGFLGNLEFPPVPGETIRVMTALVDKLVASDLDNDTRVSPYLFDAEAFSFPIDLRVGSDGDIEYRCRDAARDPHQPATGIGHIIRITCPPTDGPVTYDQVGESWRYFVGGTIQPSAIPEDAALFVTYRRLEGPNPSVGGTDWILIDKPASIFPLNDPENPDVKQFQAEGWIGDRTFPPRPGELIEVAIVLMKEEEGRSRGNQEFRTPEQIPAIDFSFPTYLYLRQEGEKEFRCEDAELSIANDQASTSAAFQDDMKSIDTSLWHRADGWTNGDPFWVGWREDHVEFADGVMRLRLDDQPCTVDQTACSGHPYASGEYRSNAFYPPGCVEGRLKAARAPGVVSSLFMYTGPSDNNPHDEVDIEILGKDMTQMQVNYFTDGVGGHETLVSLGFDAAEDFHTYAFEWSPEAIRWFVDGQVVHEENGTRGDLPSTPGRIMMNLWPGTGVDDWLEEFVYPRTPIYAEYDWIRYTPGVCPY